MKRRIAILAAVGLAMATVCVIWWVRPRPIPRVRGPLVHEAYVWQRAWTRPVREAVAGHAQDFGRLVFLNAEVTWQDKQPQVVRVAPDYAVLRNVKSPVGLALRIGPYPGPFLPAIGPGSVQPSQAMIPSATTNREAAVTGFLADLAAALVTKVRTSGVQVGELQLDFDCATSKLDGYRVWVEAIAQRVAPVPVTITALPSWLGTPAFARLAQAAPNYVLQVHSVARPASVDAPFTLCEPMEAQRAVERAGRLEVPFRVALPTYGYVLAFDSAGQFLGLSAEGPAQAWPAGARLREVQSDPTELARLVQGWTADRPKAMRGVIWYRLPVASDRRNWLWPTLEGVMAGRPPGALHPGGVSAGQGKSAANTN